MSINKVAKLAGVSISTVSRVMNNHPRVAPETAKAIRKAMRELDYKPSDRRPGPKPSLRTRTGATTIAFLAFRASRNRTAPAFEPLLNGVSQASSSYNLNLLFLQVPDPGQMPGRIIDANVNGLLLQMPSRGLLYLQMLHGGRQLPQEGDDESFIGFGVPGGLIYGCRCQRRGTAQGVG